MRIIKVLISASEELHEEKINFSSLIEHLNEVLTPRGIELQRIKWTPETDGTLDNFRTKLYDCEMCLNIYWLKLDGNSKEELDIAYQELKNGNNPRKLYIFFKEPAEKATGSLKTFKENFVSDYGHFFCKFANADTMSLHFILQLEAYQPLMTISDSSIKISGVPFVDIKNITFAANNENYQLLCQDIEKQRKRLAKHPDDLEEQKELHDLLTKRQTMEENMMDVARQIYMESDHQMSNNLIEARRLFEIGELSAVLKILKMDYIISDIRSSKRCIDNLTLLKDAEEKRIAGFINEAKLRINTEKLLLVDGWIQKIVEEYKLLIEETRNYASPLTFANLLFDAARFTETYSPDLSIIRYYIECIDVMEQIEDLSNKELHIYADMLYYAGRFFSNEVYEIDNDPTAGEWMDVMRRDDVNKKIHARIMKNWRGYRKLARTYLEKSVEIFESIKGTYDYKEDIFHSLYCLTNYEIWNGSNSRRTRSFKRLIEFAKREAVSKKLLLSALCNYATDLYVESKKLTELNKILDECMEIINQIDPTLMDPYTLRHISSVFEMKKDYLQACKICRTALSKFKDLATENPYEYQADIADCLEIIAMYVHWMKKGYKTDPETVQLLNSAEHIYEDLYKITDNDVYYRGISHIKNLKFEIRLYERLEYGKYIFDSVLPEMKEYLSNHISSGKHLYKIEIPESPIKNIGTIIHKIRNKDKYELCFTWKIDGGGDVKAYYGRNEYSKEQLRQYLLSQECYDQLKDSIIRHLDKSWNMD